MMTSRQYAFRLWERCIEELRLIVERKPGAYTEVDDVDLEVSIGARYAVEMERPWTRDEIALVERLDAEYRRLIIPAMKQVNLLGWYNTRGADYPGDWWWHVEEGNDHS